MFVESRISGEAAGEDVTSCVVTLQGDIFLSGNLAPGNQYIYVFSAGISGTKTGPIDLGDGEGPYIIDTITAPGPFTIYLPVDIVWGSQDEPGQKGLNDFYQVFTIFSEYLVRHYSPPGQASATGGAGADDTASSVNVQVDLVPSFTFATGPGVVAAGDYNHDGIVDAADYTVWRDSLGSTGNLAADGDNSGTVDLADYDLWRINFGNHTATGAGANAAVPEPSSIALACLAGLTVPSLRRHRHIQT